MPSSWLAGNVEPIAVRSAIVFTLDKPVRIKDGQRQIALDAWSFLVLTVSVESEILPSDGLAIFAVPAQENAQQNTVLKEFPQTGALDELSAAVLSDVFALTQRAEAHQMAAVNFVLHQLKASVDELNQSVRCDQTESASQLGNKLSDALSKLEKTQNELVARVKILFQQQMDESLTLEQICKICECGKTTLSAAFRNEGLPSPMRVLAQMRIHRAQESLTNTRISINEVGAIVGYPEAAAFTHFFSKHTGKSPREFRDQSQWLL